MRCGLLCCHSYDSYILGSTFLWCCLGCCDSYDSYLVLLPCGGVCYAVIRMTVTYSSNILLWCCLLCCDSYDSYFAVLSWGAV